MKGNDLVRQGKQRRATQLLRSAVAKYAEGLCILHDAGSTNAALQCALQSNQAQAHALLGNWRNSLQARAPLIPATAAHTPPSPLPPLCACTRPEQRAAQCGCSVAHPGIIAHTAQCMPAHRATHARTLQCRPQLGAATGRFVYRYMYVSKL